MSPPRPWIALPLAVAVAAAGVGAWLLRGRDTPPTPPEPTPPAPAVVGAFEAKERGAFVASPLLAGPHVYLAAVRDTGLHPTGAVLCLDRATRQLLWTFDDGGAMLHMFSTPCLADGRLYVGEGMHANFECKLYCIEAAAGRKLWDFPAAGHIESSPRVAGGRVYFGAGDDGVYCLDAATGRRVWRYPGPAHVDTSPALVGGRLYGGSGVSRRTHAPALFCLDAASGAVVWRTPTDLPVWAPPVVDGGTVICGLGNGRLTEGPPAPEKPAGAVVCLDAATGQVRWRCDACDAVFGQAAVDDRRVYVGSRDGGCYALDRGDGTVVWRRELGSPVVAGPVWAGGRLVAVGSGGRVCGLDAATGAVAWAWDVPRPGKVRPRVLGAPAVGDDGLIYLGTELRSPAGNGAVLYVLRP